MGKSATSPTSGQAQTQGSGPEAPAPKYKKVFVQRDYTHGTGVKFQTAFPVELEGYIDPEIFAYLMGNINQMYYDGEKMSGRAFCESCCACLSAYLVYACMESFYDKCARKVSNFIEEQNDTRWKPRGLLVTDPLERGLRVIEITIFLDRAEQRQPASANSTGQQVSSVRETNSRREESSSKSSKSHERKHHVHSEGHTSSKTKSSNPSSTGN
jgi:hypothetical protein